MTPEQQAAIANARARLAPQQDQAPAVPSFTPEQQAVLQRVRAQPQERQEQQPPMLNVLPLAKVPSGSGMFGSTVALAHSVLTKSISDAITAPGRFLSGETPATWENLYDEGRNAAGVIGTGSLIPRAAPEASLAMNAMSRPVRQAGRAVSTAAQVMTDPVVNWINADTAAGRALLKRIMMQNPGMTPEEALTATQIQMNRLGPNAVIADTGESTLRLARNMAQAPGQTAQFADETLGARNLAQGSRMIESTRKNISPKNFYEEAAAIKARQEKLAAPLYRQAFAANKSISSPTIDRILQTPSGREAMDYAVSRMQNRMSRMAVPDKELTEQMRELVARGQMDPVKGGVASGLKLESLDLIKQALGEQEQLLRRKVVMGTAKKGEVDDIADLRRELTKELDRLDVTAKAGPNSVRADGGAYARARRVYSEEASLDDALDAGRGFAKGDEELTRQAFNEFNAAQKEAFRIGAAREIVGMIRKDGRLPKNLRNILNDSDLGARIRLIAPDQQSYNNFVRDIERENRFQKTSNTVRGGSPTGSIAMEEGAIAADALESAGRVGGIVADAGRGNMAGAATQAMTWAVSQLRRLQMPQPARDKIGRLLLSPNAQDKQEAVRLIEAEIAKRDRAGR